ncbi:hypothetical protein E4U42_000536 [Claviceps africana]|uniref:Protein kinase domain-containing protein n=1 Tax=Claviceps africana TaxID=83212 RepID=A0A8K0JAQ4_9HYPO|nr:hypothetical protein E4U42_000536 [Claviceps africana]
MSDPEPVEVHYYMYHPPGVDKVLASGSSAFIGQVDDSTVLKYTLKPGGDASSLEHEYRLLDIIGRHNRIIAHKGLTVNGLYLERASNGTLLDYIQQATPSSLSVQQRITWCREIIEAVEYIHSKRVIHCDINPTNILLDKHLHIKLADFQGCHLNEEGQVILYARAGEPCRYFCPRDDDFEATIQTDLFAFASTIHFILTGQEVFPDIINGDGKWYERVRSRFRNGIFPDDIHACTDIAQKCWRQQYTSAHEVLEDIIAVERLHTSRNDVDSRTNMIDNGWNCVIF